LEFEKNKRRANIITLTLILSRRGRGKKGEGMTMGERQE